MIEAVETMVRPVAPVLLSVNRSPKVAKSLDVTASSQITHMASMVPSPSSSTYSALAIVGAVTSVIVKGSLVAFVKGVGDSVFEVERVILVSPKLCVTEEAVAKPELKVKSRGSSTILPLEFKVTVDPEEE